MVLQDVIFYLVPNKCHQKLIWKVEGFWRTEAPLLHHK